MEVLRKDYVERVRAGRVEYGSVQRSALKRAVRCRCCGKMMAKGTPVIRFAWDFRGCGSWTAVQCVMHETCEPFVPPTNGRKLTIIP